MQKVWELIAAKKGGLPTQIIFFEEPKIDVPGWRWAPKSLLAWGSGSHEMMNTRSLRWRESRLGKITDQGLRVQYPGYRIKIAPQIGDGKPQHWPGYPRPPEFNIFFRDIDTGEWYRIYDKVYASLNQNWTTEQRSTYNALGLFPLHDIADTGDSGLIFNSANSRIPGMHEALFGTIASPLCPDSPEEGLEVRTGRNVIVNIVQPQLNYMYNILRRLALELRTSNLAEAHMAIYRRLSRECGDGSPDLLKAAIAESRELETSVRQLQERMQWMIEEVAAKDSQFVRVVQEAGEVRLDSIWRWIYDFVAHDYVGEMIGEDQVWYVD
jgi:hypothetical protein